MPVTQNDQSKSTPPRGINNKLDDLDKRMDNLYKDIYISRPDNKRNLDMMIDSLDAAIDNLQPSDDSISGMSELLRRVDKQSNRDYQNIVNGVEDLFNDQNIIGTLFANDTLHKYIAGENYTYDMIIRYLPRLLDALEIKRDNVLCSDNFSKNFINPKAFKSSKDDVAQFVANAKRLERKYDIQDFFDKTYMNTSTYGEDFIYIVPYDVALKRVIKRTNQRYTNNSRLGQFNMYESAGYKGSQIVVQEGFVGSAEYKQYEKGINRLLDEGDEDFDKNFKGFSVTLHFNDTGMIQRPIQETAQLNDISELEKFRSLSAIKESEFNNNGESINEDSGTIFKGLSSLEKQYQKINLKNDKLSNSHTALGGNKHLGSDGLITPDNMNLDPDKIDNNFTGAVVERLKREDILPVYISNRCLGYYYFEFAEDPGACGFCGGHHMTPGISNYTKFSYDMSEDQEELAIRFISAKISSQLDTHFINANKDLKEDIYSILRYNEKFDLTRSNDIGVTFIPADDIIHCYFELDEDTHRGISDLKKSVIPAMLYILLYLTYALGYLTRSADHRVYYVKQNVEQNVARTMMNVVKQIKKGNLGMRQIESMNNMLNIIGQYNDFVIPLSQSGDSPIQFEIMQGQDIQMPSDMLDKLEESAVNATGVPMELVNSTLQQDFATRYTMSNTRFLKSIYTRQRQTQHFFEPMYTKIYNYEFNENIPMIEIILPPPLYLTIQNNSQLYDNISQMADKLAESELYDKDDDVKTVFKSLYIHNQLSTYIDYDEIAQLTEDAEVYVQSHKQPATEDGNDSEMSDEDLM